MRPSTRLLVVFSAFGLFWLVGPAPSARAGSWVFRPSYYSHEIQPFAPRRFGPVEPVRPSRTGPYVTRPQGAYVRSGWRQTRSFLHAGHGRENLNYFESFIQYGEQF